VRTAQISREYLRVRPAEKHLLLQVMQIAWPSPGSPRTYWRTVSRLPVDASPAAIAKARRAALRNPKHFRVCQECGELKPSGHMHDDKICQSCAERSHGVVY
jgi:hypothetical protein